MIHRPFIAPFICLTGFLFGSVAESYAAPLELTVVHATEQAGEQEDLYQVVNGRDTDTTGWMLRPEATGFQALILRTAEPVQAEAFDLTLCFLSGKPGSHCAECSISYTTDPLPGIDSRWTRLTIERFTATGPSLTLNADGHLLAGKVNVLSGDAVFQIRGQAPNAAVTGFRLDVFPWRANDAAPWKIGRGNSGEFILTEFRVDSVRTQTTNIALRAPVTATAPLYALDASALTDGLPGTFSHPKAPDLGEAFHFEIDLRKVRQLDHLVFRNRADGAVPDRFSRVSIELRDTPTGPVNWHAKLRADGTNSEVGAVDLLRAANGTGAFQGQFLRISSSSHIAYSPQLAEVEAYESLVPQLMELRADRRSVAITNTLEVPAGVRVLTFALKLPQPDLPDRLALRWRLRGFHSDWQLSQHLLLEMDSPPPGKYHFEAQLGHTDGEWNDAALSIPLSLKPLWWQTSAARWSTAGLVLIALWFISRKLRQRRNAREQAKLDSQRALDEERSRIARDMHDEVGASLSQLAILQEMFVYEYPVPEEAKESLNHLSATARQAVETLDHVVWAVNPRNDRLPNVVDYLTHCALTYLHPLGISCHVDSPIDWPDLPFRAQSRHQLILAFKEALHNVIKHAGATSVTLTLRLIDETRLHLTLTDNGKGLPDEPAGLEKDGLEEYGRSPQGRWWHRSDSFSRERWHQRFVSITSAITHHVHPRFTHRRRRRFCFHVEEISQRPAIWHRMSRHPS